jgi:histidine ammonia-lyase
LTRVTRLSCALLVVCVLLVGAPAVAGAQGFTPINPTKSDETIRLTGDDLTIQDVVDIARHGAKVRLSAGHRRYMSRAYALLLEGARQGIPIYRFNRGAGAGREDVIFEGDPLSDENFQLLAQRRLNAARNSALAAGRPEVGQEEIVRAMMAVRANNIKYVANGPAVSQRLVDFLNHRITPVVQGDGLYHGEGDLPQMGNVEAAMVGSGEVYYRGQRMPAINALAEAGLPPLSPFARDDPSRDMGLFRGVYSTNAYTFGQAALLVHDAKAVLDWHDLVFSVSMNGLNSSITPLGAVPQRIERPLPYANWQAERLLSILGDSYLFDFEGVAQGARLIQDPLSYRTYPWRNGAAWAAWDRLRKTTLIEINSSDHNPSTAPGVHPDDSPELGTPWFRRYYVQPREGVTEGGFLLSNSNFNKTELAGNVEQFVIALTESVHTITLRTLRIGQPFFSVIQPSDVLSAEELARAAPQHDSAEILQALVDELQALANPIPAEVDAERVHPDETTTFGSEKVAKARLALDASLRLIGQELLTATFWANVRQAQNPARSFGAVPTAVWQAFRVVVPWQAAPSERPPTPAPGVIAYAFLRANPPEEFLGEDAAGPNIKYRRAVGDGKPPKKRRVLLRTQRILRQEGELRSGSRGLVREVQRQARGLARNGGG